MPYWLQLYTYTYIGTRRVDSKGHVRGENSISMSKVRAIFVTITQTLPTGDALALTRGVLRSVHVQHPRPKKW